MSYNDKEEFEFCRSYMVADEEILWKGKPDDKIIFKGDSGANLVFGIFWLGFSLFWCFMASGGFRTGTWLLGMPLC